MPRRWILLLTALVVALWATGAAAREPERIHLRVDADPRCVGVRDIPPAVRALGEPFEHARAGERARTFSVTLVERKDDGTLEGELVVYTLDGTHRARAWSARSCAEAREAIALLVSMALDRNEPVAGLARGEHGDFLEPSTAVWPTTPERPTSGTRWRPAPSGPGGFLFAAQYDLASGYGAQVVYVARVGRLRVGPSIGISVKDSATSWDGRWRSRETIQIRPTLALAGGAPWSDFVIGYVAELGFAAGQTDGIHDLVEYSNRVRAGSARSELWASPYVAGTMLAQIPWRFDVRPFVALQSSFTMMRADQVLGLMGEAGIAWRRW